MKGWHKLFQGKSASPSQEFLAKKGFVGWGTKHQHGAKRTASCLAHVVQARPGLQADPTRSVALGRRASAGNPFEESVALDSPTFLPWTERKQRWSWTVDLY
jgi:hypothetical protein